MNPKSDKLLKNLGVDGKCFPSGEPNCLRVYLGQTAQLQTPFRGKFSRQPLQLLQFAFVICNLCSINKPNSLRTQTIFLLPGQCFNKCTFHLLHIAPGSSTSTSPLHSSPPPLHSCEVCGTQQRYYQTSRSTTN